MEQTLEERLFHVWLVQRIEERKVSEGSNQKPGVDAYFSFDYMGSAEFESGALSKNLRHTRSYLAYITEPREIRVGEHSVWYVGRREQLDLAKAFFEAELGKGLRLKERTLIDEAYAKSPKWPVRTIGWWHIASNPERKSQAEAGWAFFKEEEQAKKWLAGLRAG